MHQENLLLKTNDELMVIAMELVNEIEQVLTTRANPEKRKEARSRLQTILTILQSRQHNESFPSG